VIVISGVGEITSKRFGFPVQPIENPVLSSIGVSQVTVFRNNPDRVFWLVSVLGAGNVYLAIRGEATTSRGVFVSGLGGFASMTVDEDGESVSYEVVGIASAAATAVYCLEIEKYANEEVK
jgi:hypothetical protein